MAKPARRRKPTEERRRGNDAQVPGRRRSETRIAMLGLAIVLVTLLLPFITRAFHIDDPLFIWAAKHIQTDPANPYNFSVNWYGDDMPMSEATKNPPLSAYYMAAAAFVLGWSEAAMHGAFLLPALAVVAGAYLLAQRFCRRPVIAVLAGILTPVFVVSSLTVMSDIWMLAFWVFAVYFWMKGLDDGSHAALAAAAVSIALAAVSKYFAIALIPLLIVYALVKQRRVGWWLAYIVIPVAVLAWYQYVTQHLYGRGLLLDAAGYATDTNVGFGKFTLAKLTVNAAFAGGCVATVLFYSRQLWSTRTWIGGLVVAVGAAALIASFKTFGSFPLPVGDGDRWLLAVQLGIWATAGGSLLALAVVDLWNRRDADSMLLFGWIVGTFAFAGFVNWSTNGRSILPMVIPTGILIARRLEARPPALRPRSAPSPFVPLAAAAALSLAVAWADSAIANTARAGAVMIHDKYAAAGRTIWFQGHWGFQYYLEQLGAKPMNVSRWSITTTTNVTPWSLTPGDIIAIPATNTNQYVVPQQWVTRRELIELPSTGWLSTMNSGVGAGFYSDVWGPLPFALGSLPPERFLIMDVRPH